jgi:hypothetical protein
MFLRQFLDCKFLNLKTQEIFIFFDKFDTKNRLPKNLKTIL